MPGYELFGIEEQNEVSSVLDTGILMRYAFHAQRNNIWKAKELEKELENKLQVKHAQLTSSGTTALTTALAALGVGHADEVIMPTFTFVASFEAVISVGAIPILVDVDESLTLCPKATKAAITERTKAIMPVHMCGAMADMDALKAICEQENSLLLEDACQAFGGTYKGEALGTMGDAGTFSFDFVKTITCGEGGAVVTQMTSLYKKCDVFSDHGHDHKGVDRGADEHPYMGNNYRISELHAAVGLAQLRKLDFILETQRRNKALLKESLSSIPEITFRKIHDPLGDNASFLSFFLPHLDLAQKVEHTLKEAGFAAFHWYNNSWHYVRNWGHLKNASSLYRLSPEVQAVLERYQNQDFSASDAIMKNCISIPINLNGSLEMQQKKAESITNLVKSILN